MSHRAAWAGGAVLLLGTAGCATQSHVVQQDHQLRALIQEDRKQLEQVRRQVDRLQRALEEGAGRRGGRVSGDRVTELEKRVAELEGRPAARPETTAAAPGAGAEAPPVSSVEPVAPAPASPPPPAAPPPAAPPPPVGPAADEWQRELAREQAALGTMNIPERADFVAILDGVARKDCARAISQLNSFAAAHKESPLADNAIYWAARCYQLRGEAQQAISKFYEVGTRYPKGDKAPAALWAQGNLFLGMGNTGDGRLVLSEIIKKYPASEEAAHARQKLTEIER